MRMFTFGQYVVADIADITDIKYDGKLIILEDGTRWEVDTIDTTTAEMWSPMDKVVVIENEMFKLDDMEKVTGMIETRANLLTEHIVSSIIREILIRL